MLFDVINDIPLKALALTVVRQRLREELQTLRSRYDHRRYYAVFRVNELSREFETLADCGLQRDIHKRIAEGAMSFNQAWLEHVDDAADISRGSAEAGQGALGRQLSAVFGTHPVREWGFIIIQCDVHDFMVFLEAHLCTGESCDIHELADDYIRVTSERLYLAYLRDFRQHHVTDWERAVHELASPLDFIYTNSDFLIDYLRHSDSTLEQKLDKLRDFKMISELLIKRLHTFRFAFAGVEDLRSHRVQVDLYKLCMPVTHLWYHEAVRKGLKFRYDELRERTVVSDPELLQCIIFNLISNAIKYSFKGQEIQLYAKALSDGGMTFGVRNQGLVIQDADRYRVFEMGYRTDGARRMDARGMGIGLTVCRQLSHQLGAALSLLEDTGEWTVFELRFPATGSSRRV